MKRRFKLWEREQESITFDGKVVGITIGSVVRIMESTGKDKHMEAVSWGGSISLL